MRAHIGTRFHFRQESESEVCILDFNLLNRKPLAKGFLKLQLMMHLSYFYGANTRQYMTHVLQKLHGFIAKVEFKYPTGTLLCTRVSEIYVFFHMVLHMFGGGHSCYPANTGHMFDRNVRETFWVPKWFVKESFSVLPLMTF